MRLFLAVLLAVASAPERWTFCVAETGGADIWITPVFAAFRPREALETAFSAALREKGVARAVVQCPAPQDDKAEVFNAQFTAAEFQRKLGRTLHAFPGAPW